jgi:enduracididine beta-hydroxylase
MGIYALSSEDALQAEALCERFTTPEFYVHDSSLVRQTALFCHQLPSDLRAVISSFKKREQEGALLITGFQVDDTQLEITPSVWNTHPKTQQRLLCEAFLLLCSSLLGTPISRESQQAGSVMHDLLPIKAHEGKQINSSSTAVLTWHTEDASQRNFADYLLLMCLRNPQRAGTRLSSIEDIALPEGIKQILFSSRFLMHHDLASDPIASPDSQGDHQADAGHMTASVLFGDWGKPYVRLDSFYIDKDSAGKEAASALQVLLNLFDQAAETITLEPGNLLVIDNYRAVHGRDNFVASYNGTDRWIKRTNVARNPKRFSLT